MFSFVTMFTLGSITSQTVISVIISYLTLDCKLQPVSKELQEITIIKLLYLHDPQACGRVYFYNYTEHFKDSLSVTTINWPVKNDVAAGFRQKVKIWFGLHLIWFGFCVAYMTQGHRSCGFYATVLPFTITGLIIMAVDILYMALFLADTGRTRTERDILKYIDGDNHHLFSINKTNRNKPFSKFHSDFYQPQMLHDTTWVSLLMAYCSCRGVVFWIFNFWTIEDNYIEGLKAYRRWQADREAKLGAKDSEDSQIV